MASRRDQIPSSRLGRGAILGGLVAGQTVRYAGTAAANVARSQRARQAALERRHLEAADQLLAVLGTMKGPAMKLGQMLSVIDLGMLPEDVRPRFQERLAVLCDEAPQVPWKRMEPVLAKALGGPVSARLREIDPEPVGTASIGQVYRAVLHDGRQVALKVQYPQIVAAARADMKNLAALLRIGSSLAPSIDTDALAAELSSRLLEELDYEMEARNTQAIATAFDGHPFIAVPYPVLELCGPTLLATEYFAGAGFPDARSTSQDSRNRLGEIVMRFYLGSIFQHGLFSGDPHPGNLSVLPDGRVAFFDFGSVKQLDAGNLELARGAMKTAADRDGDRLIGLLAAHGALARPEDATAERVLALFDDIAGWALHDEPVTMTPQIASDAVILSMSPRSQYRELLSDQDLPVEWALVLRTLFMSAALLGQLGATANWHNIGREWIRGDSPVTDLGIAEAWWSAGRAQSPA
jgi:predicted unusual protein kinase regulating ubiquinone biosynthesis (AarF/ABC1/UbiB family)